MEGMTDARGHYGRKGFMHEDSRTNTCWYYRMEVELCMRKALWRELMHVHNGRKVVTHKEGIKEDTQMHDGIIAGRGYT